jgi:hypothetical protein
MTGPKATRDPDRVLAAWLDEGPTDLPDVTRRAILTALPTTRQARGGLLASWRFSQMNMFARGAAVLVVVAVAIGAVALLAGPESGIGGRPSPSPSPSAPASAPPLPSLDATVVSPSYGYQIRYPSGWTVTPGSGTWPVGATLGPGHPVTDSIVTPSGLDRMRISAASLALPGGMTMEEFRGFASPYSSPFQPDPCPPLAPITGPVMIDYVASQGASPGASPQKVAAVVSINGCHALAELGGSVYDVEAIAEGRGYEFVLDGQLTPTDALAWLASITLEPGRAPASSAAPSPGASNPAASSPAASR